jgi:hypothetical protein
MEPHHRPAVTTAAGDQEPGNTPPHDVRYLAEDPARFIDEIWQAVPATALTGVLHLAGDRRQIHVQPADQRIPPLILCPGQVMRLIDPADPASWQIVDGPVGAVPTGLPR